MDLQVDRRVSTLPAPRNTAVRVVCSWCRGEMKPSGEADEPGVANYGMCRPCLRRRLRQLSDLHPTN